MIKLVPYEQIFLDPNRQRKSYDNAAIPELVESFKKPIEGGKRQGLLQAPTVVQLTADTYSVVAGGCRYKALGSYFALMDNLWYNGQMLDAGLVPVVVREELGDYGSALAEFDENAARADLTPEELLSAIARVAEAKKRMMVQERKEASPDGSPPSLSSLVTRADVVKQTREDLPQLPGSVTEKNKQIRLAIKADELRKKVESGSASDDDRQTYKSIKKATSMKEIQKAVTASETRQRHRVAASLAGDTSKSDRHSFFKGDCLELMLDMKVHSMDGCISDIIYGIGADMFGDAAGRMTQQVHNYEDTYANWKATVPPMLALLNSVIKKDGFILLACAPQRFEELKEMLATSPGGDWRIWPRPLIQYKEGGGRCPWQTQGFRYSYENWIYAQRGNRQTTCIVKDVFTCSSDREDQYGANKPVSLLQDFLQAIAVPSDKIIDPMAGTGSLLPAAHHYGCDVTLMEQEPEQYGRILERFSRLK